MDEPTSQIRPLVAGDCLLRELLGGPPLDFDQMVAILGGIGSLEQCSNVEWLVHLLRTAGYHPCICWDWLDMDRPEPLIVGHNDFLGRGHCSLLLGDLVLPMGDLDLSIHCSNMVMS